MDEDETTVRIPLAEAVEAALSLSRPEAAEPTPLTPEPVAEAVSSPTAAAVSDVTASRWDPALAPPPPLRNSSGATNGTPPSLTIPDVRHAAAARKRYTTLGIGLFAVGVLVGVVGAAAVMKSRAAPPHETTASRAAGPAREGAAARALVPEAAKPAAVTAPELPPRERAPKAAQPVEAKAESAALAGTKQPARGPSDLPISSFRAPSCQELLRDTPVKRPNAKAALRETRLANRQLMLGNVPIAHAAYCNAFTLDRSNVDRHVNLARLYLLRRDWEKAAEYGQSALALDPKSRSALAVVGDAWAALRKLDEARTAWLAAENKPQASPRELRLIAKRNVALAARVARLNDFSLAERLYRRALLIEPENAEAMKGIAACLLKAGDYRAAEAWARRAGQLKRGN
jgi:tetratricopeptide (TPR) repeat protein